MNATNRHDMEGGLLESLGQWFVILTILLSLSCERKAEPHGGRESLDLHTQDNSATATSSNNNFEPDAGLMKDHAYLELTLQNITGDVIDEIAIVFGKNSCTFGILGGEGSAGYLGWQYPVGTNALVRWRDSGKNKREAHVDLSGIYDRTAPGNLTFTIGATNVTVSFEKLDRK